MMMNMLLHSKNSVKKIRNQKLVDNIQRIYSFSQRFSDDDLDNNNIKRKSLFFAFRSLMT